MDYNIVLAFSLATAVLAISPGPDNIFVLVQSMVNGKKNGLAIVAGLMTGCLVHTTLLAFGVSALLKQSPTIYNGIKVFGATYLLYLAFRVFKSSSSLVLENTSIRENKFFKLYRQGFIMNVLNPKVTIFFLAFFPGFLFSDNLSNVIQFYVLGALFIIVSSMVFGTIAILSGRIGTYLKSNSKVGLYLKWLQLIVFIALAVYVLIS
ncbi:LysE family translocator [Maribacter sp. CXY002]|uniref:LysE family translocator n=1 Tax=Maribacter luteocoastalis TaxID=3407671 RepID=UPI003B66F7CE